MENLNEPLLGRPAIDALNLVKGVQAIQSDQSSAIEEAKTTYLKLFKGLGELSGEFSIKLKPGSTPFALTTPRRVLLPLMKKVKAELQRMETLGVISKVDLPADWCAGMVLVPTPDGRIRICVDLTKLSESVLRETSLVKIFLRSLKIFEDLHKDLLWILSKIHEDLCFYSSGIFHFLAKILQDPSSPSKDPAGSLQGSLKSLQRSCRILQDPCRDS